METVHSVCALDCPDCCSMLVQVENNAKNGRATRLRGDPNHPVTQGFLCGKVAQYLEREYSPERLLYPQRRVGAKGEGRFERIAWDAAPPVAEQMVRSRRDALTASMGNRYSTEPEQFRHSKLIIAWGANILGTNVHLWPFIVEARRNGAKLVVIDPVKTRTAALADSHLSVNPGSDLALALGLIHVIIGENLYDAEYVTRHTNGFDDLAALARTYDPARVAALTGIASADIIQLARDYATIRPAAIRLNYGVQRSEHGGADGGVVAR